MGRSDGTTHNTNSATSTSHYILSICSPTFRLMFPLDGMVTCILAISYISYKKPQWYENRTCILSMHFFDALPVELSRTFMHKISQQALSSMSCNRYWITHGIPVARVALRFLVVADLDGQSLSFSKMPAQPLQELTQHYTTYKQQGHHMIPTKCYNWKSVSASLVN